MNKKKKKALKKQIKKIVKHYVNKYSNQDDKKVIRDRNDIRKELLSFLPYPLNSFEINRPMSIKYPSFLQVIMESKKSEAHTDEYIDFIFSTEIKNNPVDKRIMIIPKALYGFKLKEIDEFKNSCDEGCFKQFGAVFGKEIKLCDSFAIDTTDYEGYNYVFSDIVYTNSEQNLDGTIIKQLKSFTFYVRHEASSITYEKQVSEEEVCKIISENSSVAFFKEQFSTLAEILKTKENETI